MRKTVVVLSVLCALAVASHAQEPDFSHPTDEPSSSETLMDRSDLGNVVARGRLVYGDGRRELKRAAKLEKKLEGADAARKGELEEQIRAAYERAASKFTEAIRTAPNLLEAYAGLGEAFQHLGKHQERLQVHVAALKKDPDDAANFRGWAAALLELNMLGDAAQAYDHFLSANPGHAEILLSEMHSWLERRRQDPGELEPEHLEKMAAWLAERG